MLKKIYKALILSRTASAANHTLRTLSDRQLDDIDYLHGTASDIKCLRAVHAQLVLHKPESNVFCARHSEVLEALRSESKAHPLICDTSKVTKN